MKPLTKKVLMWVLIAVGGLLLVYFGSGAINGLLVKLGLKKDPAAAEELQKEKQRLEDTQNQILGSMGNTSASMPGGSISKSKAQSMAENYYSLLNHHSFMGFGGVSSADLAIIYNELKGLSQPDRCLVVAMFGTRDFGMIGQALESFTQRISECTSVGDLQLWNDLFMGTNITF